MLISKQLFCLIFFISLINSGHAGDDTLELVTPLKRLFSAVNIKLTETGLPVACSVKQKQGLVHISGTMIFHVADAMAQLTALQESPLLMQKPDTPLQVYFLKNGVDAVNRVKINGEPPTTITYYHVTSNAPITVTGFINTIGDEEAVILWPANTILDRLIYDPKRVAVYSIDQLHIYNAAMQAVAGIGLLDRNDIDLPLDIRRKTQQAELLVRSTTPSTDAHTDFDRITAGTTWLCDQPFTVEHYSLLKASIIHLCGTSLDQMSKLKDRFPNLKANLITYINHPKAPCGLYAREDFTCMPGFKIVSSSDLVAILPLDASDYSFVIEINDGKFFVLENHRGIKIGHLALGKTTELKKGSLLDAASKGVLSPSLVLALTQEFAKRTKPKQRDLPPAT